MHSEPLIEQPLLDRYANSGPRYTSYPTVKQFHSGFNENHFQAMAAHTNEDLVPKPLSLYLHIPFCKTVCFYCACNKIVTANQQHAVKYLSYLQREIAMVSSLFDADRQINQLHLGGGTPTYLTADQLASLMDHLRQNFSLREDDLGDYSIEIDPRQFGHHTVADLRRLGFNRLSIGMQDLDEDVQKAVNRIQSFEQTADILIEAREYGFHSTNLDLIYGLPKQTVESFHYTLEKVLALQPDRLAIYNYAHLPNMFKVQKQINEADLPSAQTRLDILNLAIQTLNSNGYEYIGMDHFAKPTDTLCRAQHEGHLHRNFMGYSTLAECDLIGLGVSSISQIGDCYSQNFNKLEDYYECVAAGHLPIRHGRRLDLDDRLRRTVIMDLICQFELQIEDIEDQYHIQFEDYFYNELIELEPMQADGLIDINSQSLHISLLGRFFIRNICSVFDKYYRPEASNHQQYSNQV